MLFCDHTFSEPPLNLAFDEVLLDMAEQEAIGETLRFWEPQSPFVVVGYGNHVEREVNRRFCDAHGIPIFRRSSGGGTVLQGPGVLNYSLVLSASANTPFASIAGANREIMERNRRAVSLALGTDSVRDGCTDLVWNGRKFSGNAQRRKRNFLLFHGTFLLNADITLIEQALAMPSKQPKYREQRSHRDFLVNLEIDAAKVKESLRDEWGAKTILAEIPEDRVAALSSERYEVDEWRFKF